ncbi:MAG: uroporphyrinogen-III C-methyltransferase [Gammaproteobacteria bacterium]|nr:uroporphyrinogen-III C-methyltransferase [Gammaproteobacteria bacterium]
MSDEQPMNDAASSNTLVPVPAAAAEQAPPPPARRRAALLLAWTALIVALVTAAGGYYLARESQRRLLAGQRQTAVLAQRLEALQAQSNARAAQIDTALRALGSRQQTLQAAVDALNRLAGTGRHGWLLAEAKYLLNVANQRLLLERDVPTAIAALSTADRRLRATGDPGLLPVRKKIAAEIEALKAVPQPDVTGMALRLEALASRVDALPLASAQPRAVAAPADGQGAGASPPHGWRQALEAVWSGLRRLVVVRHTNHPPAPMLAPSQQYFLYQNLILKLETARLALLNGDAPVFRDSLSTAGRWIGTYFDTRDAAVAGALKQLQQMAAVNIHPALPDISASLRLLRQRINHEAAAP